MLNVTRDDLRNGLPVIYLQLPHVHATAMSFTTRGGPRYEAPISNGLSHVLEHLLFRGTRQHPSSLRYHVAVEELGGEINGLTHRDAVTAHLTVPPDRVTDAIALLGELCTEPLLEGLDVERNVILEEILDTQDADGRELDPDTLSRRALWAGHPMGMSITGPTANVRRFHQDDARALHARTFNAANGVVCIAGPLSVEAIAPAVERAFGALPRGVRLPEPGPATAVRWAPVQVQSTDDAQVTALLTFNAPHENHPDYTTLLLLKRILDDGFGARLRQAICEQRGLAYALSVTVDAYGDCGALDVEVTCAPDNLVAAVTETLRVLAALASSPVPEAELERARTRHRADLGFCLDDPEELCSWLGGAALLQTSATYADRYREASVVSPEAVRGLAEQLLGPRETLLTLVGPVQRAQAARLCRLLHRPPQDVIWLGDHPEQEATPLAG